MNETIIIAAIALPAIALAATLYWVDRVRRREALFRWASSNDLKLLIFRQPLLTEASAFPFAVSKSQHVFKVEVESADGSRRSGWVRLGSAWWGLASSTADVKWR